MNIIYNQDVAVAVWVAERTGAMPEPPFTAIGFQDRAGPVAGAVFNDYVPGGNIEMTLAADRPFSRTMFCAIAAYVFGDLGCARLSVRTRASNEHVRDLATRFGFTQEAVIPAYYGDDDAVLFGILRSNCRWLH